MEGLSQRTGNQWTMYIDKLAVFYSGYCGSTRLKSGVFPGPNFFSSYFWAQQICIFAQFTSGAYLHNRQSISVINLQLDFPPLKANDTREKQKIQGKSKRHGKGKRSTAKTNNSRQSVCKSKTSWQKAHTYSKHWQQGWEPIGFANLEALSFRQLCLWSSCSLTDSVGR